MFDSSPGYPKSFVHTRLLPILGMTDDYNHYIGGVDIADQLRANFSTHQQGYKPWRALFYWLLDVSVINAYLIYEKQRKTKLRLARMPDKIRSPHRRFRESLVLALLKEILRFEDTALPQYITKNTLLPHIRLTRPIGIHIQIPGPRVTCLFCRWS
jgi:hypothetical protein